MTHRLLLALVLVCAAAPSAAGIYGYVDERGIAHISDVPLEGYVIFRKDPPPGRTGHSGTISEAGVANVLPHAARTERQMEGVALAPLVTHTIRDRYSSMIAKVAHELRVEATLLHAVITVESGYNALARSPKGASGLMQLTAATATRYGVTDVWDPMQNLRGGARYLRDLLALFNNDLVLTLAAYNAGEGAVARFGNKIPPFAETRNYVPRVLLQYERNRATRAKL